MAESLFILELELLHIRAYYSVFRPDARGYMLFYSVF